MVVLKARDQEIFERFYMAHATFLFGIGQQHGLNTIETEKVLFLLFKELWQQPEAMETSNEKYLSVYLVRKVIDASKTYIRS